MSNQGGDLCFESRLTSPRFSKETMSTPECHPPDTQVSLSLVDAALILFTPGLQEKTLTRATRVLD